MADVKDGIHPDVMNHIIDLHRKMSDLQLQQHDRQGGSEQDEPHEIFHQMLAELKSLNANLEKLIPAVKADTQADLQETHSDEDDEEEDE